MLRPRRSQRDGGGVPAPCIGWQGHDRSSYLPDDHGGPSALVGVVGGQRVHACGDGGDRRLLKPVWHILDDGEFELVLANAAHVKNVPGRKTGVNDAMWLAEVLAHGLIRASFVPDTQTQEMRNLLRTRKQLVREQSSHVLRVQK